MSFLTQNQLHNFGFKSLGQNVLISDKASIYSPELISIGSNVRVDNFSRQNAKIIYAYISVYTALFDKIGFELFNYTGLSPRTTIFSASNDYSTKETHYQELSKFIIYTQ